jgi:fibrillarin-like pre-rRNA processing protein
LTVRVEPHPSFEGVYLIEDAEGTRLATANLAPGYAVYGEALIKHGGIEYRVWNPYRSKLAAAILKGIKQIFLRPGSRVLYLGAASGTTLSHVSDIVGLSGVVYGVDFSPKVMQQLLRNVVEKRKNTVPILEDASRPEYYAGIVGVVDVLYVDVAQPTQATIAAANAKLMLRKGGGLLLAVKARSIDSVEDPQLVVKREVKALAQSGFDILESLELEPYDRDHVMVAASYHG